MDLLSNDDTGRRLLENLRAAKQNKEKANTEASEANVLFQDALTAIDEYLDIMFAEPTTERE